MSRTKRTGAVVLAVVLVLSVVGPAVVAADEHETSGEIELDVDVEQNDDVVVTVTDNGTALENATVDVRVDDENATYDGAGEHVTDENGTAELPTPNETVNVTVSATYDNVTAVTQATLIADDEEEDETEPGPFGQQVSAFVHSLLEDGGDENLTIGQQISAFVLAHNPGNAPDHAGEQGPPDHAGPDGERGPPAHAGGPDGGDADSDDADDDDDNDDRGNGGPPAHAGGPGGDADSDDE